MLTSSASLATPHTEAGSNRSPSPGSDRDLSSLYRQHAADVARYAARLGGPDVDLDDVVHDVFLVVQRRLPAFDGRARITTWLYRITLHVIQSHRRKRRLRTRVLGFLGDSDAVTEPSPPTPIDVLQSQQDTRLVYEALDGLRERDRSVLILFELEGMKGEEIAEIMDAKVETVWVWLHRARAQFLKRVKQLEARRGARTGAAR